MIKILSWFVIFLVSILCFWIQPVAAARQVEEPAYTQVLLCFSGGKEIVRKTIVEGPFADEYKFAHEVKVLDEQGKHNFNFSGGLCIIDQGPVSVKRQLDTITDRLSCYSGAEEVINFEVYGRETTVDEYLEGRTFLAKARGNFLNSDSINRYLVFGGGTCLGEETK